MDNVHILNTQKAKAVMPTKEDLKIEELKAEKKFNNKVAKIEKFYSMFEDKYLKFTEKQGREFGLYSGLEPIFDAEDIKEFKAVYSKLINIYIKYVQFHFDNEIAVDEEELEKLFATYKEDSKQAEELYNKMHTIMNEIESKYSYIQNENS